MIGVSRASRIRKRGYEKDIAYCVDKVVHKCMNEYSQLHIVQDEKLLLKAIRSAVTRAVKEH